MRRLMGGFWEGGKFEDGSGFRGLGAGGFGGRGVCLLLSYSFPFFSFLGGVWVGGVQSQGRPRYSLFLGRREEWRGEGEEGRGGRRRK